MSVAHLLVSQTATGSVIPAPPRAARASASPRFLRTSNLNLPLHDKKAIPSHPVTATWHKCPQPSPNSWAFKAHKYLQGGKRVGGARLFSAVPSGRTRGDRHRTETWGVPCKHEEEKLLHHFPKGPTPLPRKAVEFPSLEILKTHVDALLCNL